MILAPIPQQTKWQKVKNIFNICDYFRRKKYFKEVSLPTVKADYPQIDLKTIIEANPIKPKN